MKFLRLLLWILLIAVTGITACQPEAVQKFQSEITLYGTIKNLKDTTIGFTYDTYSLLASSHTADVHIDSSGRFELTINSNHPIKGFISFGKVPKTYLFDIIQINGQDSSLQVESVDFRMIYLYLTPGDSLNFKVDANQIDQTLEFSGPASDNNLFVNKEEWEFNSYKRKYLKNYYTITYLAPDAYKESVFTLKEEKKSFMKDFQSNHSLGEHLLRIYQSQYEQEATRSMIYYPDGHAGFNQDQYPDLPENYFDFVNQLKVPDQIDDLGIGSFYFLSSWLSKKYELAGFSNMQSPEFYAFVEKELPKRMAYVYKAYALGRDFKKELYDDFGESCPYPEIALLVKEKYRHLEGMLEGQPAPGFELTDPEGRLVSLNDLVGKYIYIDFWATWCGPCIKEIPSLKILQEEFKNDPIHFVSISFDKEEDSLNWKNFVKDNKLTGKQLWAKKDEHEKFSKTFNIKSIPRFVLLDKEGKIIDANAPRPSNPGLKEILSELVDN